MFGKRILRQKNPPSRSIGRGISNKQVALVNSLLNLLHVKTAASTVKKETVFPVYGI